MLAEPKLAQAEEEQLPVIINDGLSASASMQEDIGGHLFQNEWKVDGSGFLMGRRRLTGRGGFKQKHLRNISLPLPPVHV
jgi:hypothetical protein